MVLAVTGKIEAAIINKNFSELASKLDNVNGGPIDTLTGIDGLNTKYPNGADGNVIVLENDGKTGYIYIWNAEQKKWEKGPLYQEKGIAPDSVDRPNLKREAVSSEKTNFIRTGKNKFNPNKVTKGFYIHPDTGKQEINVLYECSDYIDISDDIQVTINSSRFYATYDKDGNWVSGGTGGGDADYKSISFIVPSKAVFLRTSHRIDKNNNIQVESGNKITEYEEFSYDIDNLKITKNQIPNFMIEPKTEIPEDSISSNKTNFIKAGKNKFNPSKVMKGVYVNPADGNLLENEPYDTSEFIGIKGEKVISINHSRFYAVYDKNYKFIFSGDGTSANNKVHITNVEEGYYLRTCHVKEYTDSRIQVEFNSECTTQETYYEFLDGIRSNKNESEINFPQKIYSTVGYPLEIFSRNILKENVKDYNVMFTCDFGETTDKSYKLKPTGKGSLPISFSVFKNEDIASEKKSTIVMTEKRTTPITVNVIGDSTINCDGNGEVTKEMLNIIDDNLKLVGIMGEAPNLWEGRRGWTAARYRTSEEYEGKVNPFYNPSKKDFDYSYYISNNKLPKVDVVVLNLGINDTFAPQTKEKFEEVLPKIKADFEHIFKSIKEYRSDIKIILNLAIPPTDKLDIFYKNYGQNKYRQTQWRYKYNNYEWVKMLINDYEGKEGMYLVPIFLVVDTFNDIKDGVHPVVEGYKKIGLQVASCINSF